MACASTKRLLCALSEISGPLVEEKTFNFPCVHSQKIPIVTCRDAHWSVQSASRSTALAAQCASVWRRWMTSFHIRTVSRVRRGCVLWNAQKALRMTTTAASCASVWRLVEHMVNNTYLNTSNATILQLNSYFC